MTTEHWDLAISVMWLGRNLLISFLGCACFTADVSSDFSATLLCLCTLTITLSISICWYSVVWRKDLNEKGYSCSHLCCSSLHPTAPTIQLGHLSHPGPAVLLRSLATPIPAALFYSPSLQGPRERSFLHGHLCHGWDISICMKCSICKSWKVAASHSKDISQISVALLVLPPLLLKAGG